MDELKLNTLRRFAKRSDQLLLEHYSHCEVPAGCGGVILRWREKAEGAMGAITVYCPRRVSLTIDGAAPTSSRLLLPWGRHVLTATIDQLPRKSALLVSLQTKPRHRTVEGRPPKPQPVVLSAPDGSWRYTTAAPGEGWQAAGFDDSGWSAMTPAPPPVKSDGTVPWILRQLTREGAKPVGVPGAPERVWIRRAFVLEGP